MQKLKYISRVSIVAVILSGAFLLFNATENKTEVDPATETIQSVSFLFSLLYFSYLGFASYEMVSYKKRRRYAVYSFVATWWASAVSFVLFGVIAWGASFQDMYFIAAMISGFSGFLATLVFIVSYVIFAYVGWMHEPEGFQQRWGTSTYVSMGVFFALVGLLFLGFDEITLGYCDFVGAISDTTSNKCMLGEKVIYPSIILSFLAIIVMTITGWIKVASIKNSRHSLVILFTASVFVCFFFYYF